MTPQTDPTDDRSAVIGSVLGCLALFLVLLAAVGTFGPYNDNDRPRLTQHEADKATLMKADPS